MIKNELKDDKRSDLADDEPWGTIAFVVKMPLAEMPQLVRAAQEVPTARIIYKKTSAGRLKIINEPADGEA